MQILNKIRKVEERTANKKLNIVQNLENIISNELSFDNLNRNNKIINEKRKREERIIMMAKDCAPGSEDEDIKDDNQKTIYDKHVNKSQEVYNKTLNTIISIDSNDIKIKSKNTQNIKKENNYKNGKIMEILEYKQKNNKIIEKILLNQGINDESYISQFKKPLKNEFNRIYLSIFYILTNIYFTNKALIKESAILQYMTLFKQIIIFIIIGVFDFS
jgi:hypothetical protein